MNWASSCVIVLLNHASHLLLIEDRLMSDVSLVSGLQAAAQSAQSGAVTAGALLRKARQERGLQLSALASAIKVAPQKLELLEADRLSELPGDAFVRALAQTMCRSLQIEAAPVMALLPFLPGHGLDQMSRGGLNQPFNERLGRGIQKQSQWLKSPLLWGALLLAVAAVGVYLVPEFALTKQWWAKFMPNRASSSTATIAPAVNGVVTQTLDISHPGTEVGTVLGMGTQVGLAASAALPDMLPAATTPTAVDAAAGTLPTALVQPLPPGLLQVRSQASSWIEVLDRRGVALLARQLQAGEVLALDGEPPLRVKVGNASKVQVFFKGQVVDLVESTSRANVAKIELK
jgi:cytoskeleton protein RodZ